MTLPIATPIQLHSLSFGFPGNPGSIPLRDPKTLDFLGDTPEWTAEGRSVPAAFVAGTKPTVRAVFARNPASPPLQAFPLLLTAASQNAPVKPVETVLQFDPRGQSNPVDFTLAQPLPVQSGKITVTWNWQLTTGETATPIARSTHEFFLTWRMPVLPYTWAWKAEPSEGPAVDPNIPWVYLPIMQWVCDWTAGLEDEKAICDAVLARVRESGLVYAGPGINVRQMLLTGGGYCGAWYRMFQAMVGAHGVTVQRRTIAVDWRSEALDTARWCAIVVENPGLNRTVPLEDPSTFHDVDQEPVDTAPVADATERRYRFWGSPTRIGDGHCVNFLHYQGTWYLYDACFMTEAIPLPGFTLPLPNPRVPVSVAGLGPFKTAYLDRAVTYMMGSLYNHGTLIAVRFPKASDPHWRAPTLENGLTVQTAVLPEGEDTITFYWLS